MSQAIELLKALTPLAWPLMVGIVLWILFPILKAIVTSRAFSVKIAGTEITVQDATEQFRAQIEDLQKTSNFATIRTAGATTPQSKEPVQRPISKTPRILWVDDNPTNNALENCAVER